MAKEQTTKTPKHEALLTKYSQYKSYFSSLYTQQKEDDDFYELDFESDVPSTYDERVPNTAREWVEAGVRNYALDNPKCIFQPRNSSDKAREQVEKLELIGNFVLNLFNHEIKRGAKKLLKRGEVFIRIDLDSKFYGTSHPDRLYYWPVMWSFPDPMNTLPSPSETLLNPFDCFEGFSITIAEAKEIVARNGWDWTTRKKDTNTVSWKRYTCPLFRSFWIDDMPVLTPAVQDNIYKFCNYLHIDAGLGDDNYEGKPEFRYTSIIKPRRDMFKMEVRQLSSADAIVSRYSFPRWEVTGDPELVKKIYPRGVPSDPEQFIKNIEGQLKVALVQGEQPPEAVFRMLDLIHRLAAVPDVLAGINPTGVYSGQQVGSLVATAKPNYKDPFKNYEDLLAKAVGMTLRMLEQVNAQPIAIMNMGVDGTKKWTTIKPSDIDGHYDCEVQFLAEPPEATDMRKMLGKNLRQAGSISKYEELRYYHNKSEKEAWDEIAQQIAEQSIHEPIFREIMTKNSMERLGMKKWIQALEEAAQISAKQITGGIPPPQKSEKGMEAIKTQGRLYPGLEGIETPPEREMANV